MLDFFFWIIEGAIVTVMILVLVFLIWGVMIEGKKKNMTIIWIITIMIALIGYYLDIKGLNGGKFLLVPLLSVGAFYLLFRKK